MQSGVEKICGYRADGMKHKPVHAHEKSVTRNEKKKRLFRYRELFYYLHSVNKN